MKGDFSRGHRPDRKRGFDYRRVLLQQGRVLLDSDVAALGDALDGQLRHLANLGCSEGSPDYGYLITPGRLLAIFDEIDDTVRVSAGTLEHYRDYSRKYLDRTPSLFLGATSGVNGTAQIALRNAVTADVAFWVRSDVATPITVNGLALAVPASADFQRVVLTLGAVTDTLDVELTPGQQVWIGLIEEGHPTPLTPEFAVTSGKYLLNGLILACPADGYWPGVSYPPAEFPTVPDFTFTDPVTAAVRTLQNNDRIVAYLEGWERHITRVEDPGIYEIALGGGPDTCTRTQAVGQVKLGFAGALSAAEIIDAFHGQLLTDGTLAVTTPPAPVDPDPCALPAVGGYTGSDNRLYRFEVHLGGPLLGSLLKWSRDNGSELFAVRAPTTTTLTFPAGSGLLSGDLVEVLSDHTELADATVGVISTAPASFTAPDRAVGVVARLIEAPSANADEESFTLVDPDDESIPVTLTLADFGDPLNPALKVRRWHGLIRPSVTDPFVVEIEDGIEVSLTGSFSPGDYWLYEARVAGSQANGPWQATPHGPERFFTPLALLEFNGTTEPLELIAWLDDRFSPICELNADDIAFDGDRIGTDSDTVQEVIEELWEREHGGCCDHTLEPTGEELSGRLNAILASTTGDVVICLHRGVYPMEGQVVVAGRRVAIHGCPTAVVAHRNDTTPFVTVAQGHLLLDDLTLLIAPGAGARAIVDVELESVGLTARSVGFLTGGPSEQQVSLRVGGQDPIIPGQDEPQFPPVPDPAPDAAGPSIDAQDCVFVAGWAMSGAQVAHQRFAGCAIYTVVGGVQCSVSDAAVFDATTIVTGVDLAFTGELDGDVLLADPDPLLTQLAGLAQGAGGGLACLNGFSWQNTRVADCVLRAAYGIAVAAADDIHCHDNSYRCSESAIFLVATRAADIRSEIVGGPRGGQTVAVHLARTVTNATIRDCLLSGCRDGIVILDDVQRFLPPQFDASIDGLLITDNTVQAFGAGIVVGALDKQPGTMAGVRVEGNNVRANEFGIVVRRFLPEQTVGREIRVGENRVESLQCLYVDFAPCVVEDNRFVFAGGINNFVLPAASLRRVTNVVLVSNVFELVADSPVGQPVAILLEGGANGFIAGNSVTATPRSFAVTALRHNRLQVIDNDFGDSDCQLQQCPEARFDGNQAGAVTMSSLNSATVRANRLEALVAGALSGHWQVNDNRATGLIALIPALTGAGPFLPGGFTSMAIARTVDTIRVFAGSAENPGTVPLLGNTPARALATELATNPAWAAEWTDAVVAETLGTLVDLDVLALPGSFAALNFAETVYQAQVVGNWCAVLQVGRGIGSQGGTTVVVTSNRATSQLLVTNYADAIMSHNAAPSMPTWLASPAGDHLADRNIRE